MTKRIYITTPIYYVNDKPHLGHVYTTVAADFLARYHRLEGREVFFLTGTDEHGQKAEQAARAKGQSTKDHVDFHSAVFRDLWKKMNVSNDDFIRTTEERHTKVVQAVLQHLFDRGEIYEDVYEGWYCVPDERFWTEKDLADGNCPECGRKVERIKEKNYFFRMGKHQQWLIEYIKANEDYISPPARRNEALGFLQKKLEDLCISRPKSRMAWGVELPFDSDYVSYVWFDALLNYISAPGYQSDEKKFSEIWPAHIHLIGKDILTTHAVYWSTMLKDMGLPLPLKIFAHGWWTIEGRKMSKSFGNVVDPVTVAEAVGLDPFRYFLMREVPFGLDGDFSVEALVTRINVDLANNLGNLVSRALKMITKYRGGVIPSPHGAPPDKLKTGAEQAARSYAAHLNSPAFHKALEEIISLCDIVNGFIMENEPWKLAKDESQSERLDDVLYGSAEALRFIGRMIAPIMPETGEKLLALLGMEKGGYGLFEWGGLAPGTEVKDGDPLFPRIDDKKKEAITQAILPSGGDEEESGLIAIEDVRKIDLRTAKIVKAERIEKSRKLLKLIVDLGFEKRQIVAGIAESYSPEELVGKQVVVVANLRPAKLMGVESKGMLLAADNEGRLSLIGATNDVNGGLKVL